MVRLLLVSSVVAALLVPAAAAALVPVPLVVQQAIKKRTSALGYVPARVPFGFRYARWSYDASPQPATRIWFRRRLKPPSWQITFVAWRCVAGPKGSVRLTAATPIPPTAFAAVGLAQVAAAGHRIR